MSQKDWQVGPVLKSKPNSQGTLFRGGTKYSSDKRFPRGYTPERQAEVADAVVQPSHKVFFNKPNETSTGTASDHFKDRRVTVGLNPKYPEGYRMESRQETRRLVDTVARSTVPVDHLRGVQFRTNSSDQMLGQSNVSGHYDQRGDAMSHGDPVIRIREGRAAGSIPIHEIGHHVSSTQGNPWKSNYSYSSEDGGHEEAFADNYAEQHYRDRKGRSTDVGTYGGGKYAGRIERSDEFWDGYHKNRSSAMYSAHVDRENAKYYKKYPEQQQHPDGSMDVPLIEKPWTGEGETPTTNINEDALPERRWL